MQATIPFGRRSRGDLVRGRTQLHDVRLNGRQDAAASGTDTIGRMPWGGRLTHLETKSPVPVDFI